MLDARALAQAGRRADALAEFHTAAEHHARASGRTATWRNAIFISEKSVERHVSRIFAKLGVSRRTELAVRVASLRLRSRAR